MNHVKELEQAYRDKEALLLAGNPSNPSHALYTTEMWLTAYSEVVARIYALEEALAALSP